MFAFSVLLICFFLGIRSLLIGLIEHKFWAKRVFDLGLALIYFLVYMFLFIGVDYQEHSLPAKFSLLIGSGSVLALLLYFRFKRKKPRTTLFSGICKTGAFTCLLIVSFGLFGVSAMRKFTEDRPILRITMTGQQKVESLTWKNPSGTLNQKEFPSYEVRVETLDGKLVSSTYVPGEHVAIRAKVIRFKPIFIALGLDNMCSIEGLFNGYTTIEKTNALPVMGYSLPIKQKTFTLFLAKWWHTLFFQEEESFLVKSATLESTHFPLVDRSGDPFVGSYLLTITEGGLTSLPDHK